MCARVLERCVLGDWQLCNGRRAVGTQGVGTQGVGARGSGGFKWREARRLGRFKWGGGAPLSVVL